MTPDESALLQDALARHWQGDRRIRQAKMFGAPGFFLGRRLVACLFRPGVALKLPEPMAQAVIHEGRGIPFRPLDRAALRSWVHLVVTAEELPDYEDLLSAAVDFVASVAETQSARPKPRKTKKPAGPV